MKKPLQFSFLSLVGLTLLTGIISYLDLISTSFAPVFFMGIALGKFNLVAFEFMELRKAHQFWKVATLIIGIVLATSIAFFTFR